MKQRTIAIVAGGDSSELPVSLKSAEGIYSFMDKSRYEVFIVTIQNNDWRVRLDNGTFTSINRSDFSFEFESNRKAFDFAYITIHGTPGEDGVLQGYFDLLNIPYSNCGVLASALTFNKFFCNQFLKGFGIRIADSILLRENQNIADEEVVSRIGLPCFIKPNAGGSSFGVSKVKTTSEIQPAIEKAFKESTEVVIEALMVGTEVTCGCYKTKEKAEVFPITEVVTHNEFFDFDAKYNGQVDEITPARISADLTDRIQKVTSAIYDIIGCSGIIRADFMITNNNIINLIEVNTTPGMTPTSFIPQQVKAAGLNMQDVITDIIENKYR